MAPTVARGSAHQVAKRSDRSQRLAVPDGRQPENSERTGPLWPSLPRAVEPYAISSFRLFHVVSGDSQGYPDVWWVCTKDALQIGSGSGVD